MEDLIDTPDGLLEDESFQWSRGDQCVLGLEDKDSGLPYMASTAWGTNSGHIREALSVECDERHEHQGGNAAEVQPGGNEARTRGAERGRGGCQAQVSGERQGAWRGAEEERQAQGGR